MEIYAVDQSQIYATKNQNAIAIQEKIQHGILRFLMCPEKKSLKKINLAQNLVNGLNGVIIVQIARQIAQTVSESAEDQIMKMKELLKNFYQTYPFPRKLNGYILIESTYS